MILQPLNKKELSLIFDDTSLAVLEFCMRKALIAQPERLLNQPPLPIQVPKEHIEQWVVQAIGAIPVGAGSYPVDIIKPKDFGADIKMLSCKLNVNGTLSDTTSGETSLAQKFSGAGVDLDSAFAKGEFNEIVDDWKSILLNKFNRVYLEQSIDKILYIFILRGGNKFYLCACKVNTDNISHMCPSLNTSTHISVYIDKFIDDNFGNAKIYKSKKRLELRLKPKYWVENGYTIEFDFSNYIPPIKNLRQMVENKTIDNYLKNIMGYVLDDKNR
ncbi:MAG: hypothetical protein SO136_01075 [Sarcina ventriculi]|nr:hypothetical protein [Sarcina ventriculi]